MLNPAGPPAASVEAPPPAAGEVEVPQATAPPFDQPTRDALYRVLGARRDVRRGFLPTLIPDDLLTRILSAAHSAPSVGLMQPWRFVLIRSLATRTRIHNDFVQANTLAAETYTGEQQALYKNLKLEGILEAPQNLCVLFDPSTPQGHGLGRQSMPEMALYSVICAIQNLWLAARAEGIGVGWVSILSPGSLREILAIPDHIQPIAYLCLGFVEAFASEPDLERTGWQTRTPLSEVLHYDHYRSEEPTR